MDTTTIKICVNTRDRLKNLGKKDQTYDEIVNQVLDKQDHGEVP
jgi:hypothetical protein